MEDAVKHHFICVWRCNFLEEADGFEVVELVDVGRQTVETREVARLCNDAQALKRRRPAFAAAIINKLLKRL